MATRIRQIRNSEARVSRMTSHPELKGNVNSNNNEDEEQFDPSVPYTCVGNFQTDFRELCRRMMLAVIPPVVPRAIIRNLLAPAPVVEDNKRLSKPGKSSAAATGSIMLTPVPSDVADSSPKTYVCKENMFEYFKPSVQVVMEAPDKPESVTEVYIQGWKIDMSMMDVLKRCWTSSIKLHTINLWKVALSHETLVQLSTFLPECPTLKTLILDNNPISSEAWYLLISPTSPIQNLSLRYNQITDCGAKNISTAIGTLEAQNQTLLTLNLTGNCITDVGAKSLAECLRWNRTLLWLCLGGNSIGNEGAKSLSEVISRFRLNHEEVVLRRRLTVVHSDRKSPSSKRPESMERPGSVRASSSNTSGMKGKPPAKLKKEEPKGKPAKPKELDTKDAKASKKASNSSLIDKTSGNVKKTGNVDKSGKNRRTNATFADAEAPDGEEIVQHPVLDFAEHNEDGELMIRGNMSLISLILSGNKIGDEGARAFATAIAYQAVQQSQTLPPYKSSGPGLMKLNLERNKQIEDLAILRQINYTMSLRDPTNKPSTLEQTD